MAPLSRCLKLKQERSGLKEPRFHIRTSSFW